jgi:glycosyltransferase involved in cell wall biosynthesis
MENLIHLSDLRNLKYFFGLRRDDRLKKGKVSCIMCVWNEQYTIKYALESSKSFVDQYIIIDKNGETLKCIKDFLDKNDYNYISFVKPSLNLKESRGFALEYCEHEWILIQDGDEIFRTTGKYSINNLRHYMNIKNVCFIAPMITLRGNFSHVDPNLVKSPPHVFLYHNNGTLRMPKDSRGEFPLLDGWIIVLEGVYKFNCSGCKSPKRLYLRNKFWKEWNLTQYSKVYPQIEDYVNNKYPELDINIATKEWYESYINKLEKYDPSKYGPLPLLISNNENER